MRVMKDSSVKWIGEIPERWEIVRIKNVIEKSKDGIKVGPFGSALSGRMQSNADFNVYSQANLIADDFSSTKNTINSTDFEILKNYEVKSGDVCISMMGTVGKCKTVPDGISRGIMDSHLIKVRLNSSVINNRFFEYVYDKDLGAVCFEQIKLDKKGTIMDGLNTTVVKTLFLPLPSFSEQSAIANYLDKKCAAIDTVIEKEQQVIEKLTEYKQSVITEAVTKGLNPDVPMKDSGIEWIGEIPAGWNVKSLRYVGTCQNGISKGGDFFGTGFPFISYSDVYKNMKLPEQGSGLVESDENEQENYSVQRGDVFFTRTSETIEEIGLTSVCLKTIDKATFAGFLIRVRPYDNQIIPEFSAYYFRSNIHRQFFVKEMNLVTRASLGQELLKRLPVLLPSLSEQTAIANYLDKKCASIDNVIAKKQQLIDKLTEYKKSLIYEMVTGKKEVPLC